MADVITVDSLTKRYGDVVAVDDISFGVHAGEIFGLLGPNGAGKTTTLECIEGLVQPTAGSISVLGLDIARHSSQIARRIGVQLQASAYFDYLTLREILDLFARIYGCESSADDLLATVELRDRADSTVAKLSGGQQQRFAIAATLVNDPELIFLDEPTGGLDPQARRGLWQFVRRLNEQGRTVVMTTHYMEEAEFLCDRVAIMNNGRTVALDSPASLVRSLATSQRITVRFAGAGPKPELRALNSVIGMIDGPANSIVLESSDSTKTIPALMNWSSETGATMTGIEVTSGNLEDVFISLTGRELQDST